MGWRLAAALDWLFWHITVPILRVIAPLFFRREYLAGKHFSDRGGGWRWVMRSIVTQRVLRYNRDVPWPVSPLVVISNPRNIKFHIDDLHNFQAMGAYFQNFAACIEIGRGTYIAPNVGLITANHDPLDPSKHLPGANIVIGEQCWIGMNATIMPGVELGAHTVVGAGSVVTKSFPLGWVVLAGVPARAIRHLVDPSRANQVR